MRCESMWSVVCGVGWPRLLGEDIEWMSKELQRKDSLLTTLRSHFPALTSWLETSQAGELAPQNTTSGELAPQNTTSALGHTVLWEPSSSGWRPSCSTPNRGTPWTEVVVHEQTRSPSGIHGGAPSTPSLQLSNKYAALSVSKALSGTRTRRHHLFLWPMTPFPR